MSIKSIIGEFERQVSDQVLNDLINVPVDPNSLYAKVKAGVVAVYERVDTHFDKAQLVEEKTLKIEKL